jgi:hypothetical protein
MTSAVKQIGNSKTGKALLAGLWCIGTVHFYRAVMKAVDESQEILASLGVGNPGICS